MCRRSYQDVHVEIIRAKGEHLFVCQTHPLKRMHFLECLKMSGREMFLSQKLKSVLLVICEKQSCTDCKSVLADKYITCRKWKVELRKQP